MKTFPEFINEIRSIQEELTPSQKKRVDAWPETKRRNISFSDHVFGGPDNHRVTIPLESHKTEIPHEVKSHLEQHGMSVDPDSYEKGHATDKYNRQVRIGSALEKTKAPDHVKKAFVEDPQRSLKDSTKNLQVVITRHPHDVAGMTSKGQPWKSCMDFSSGSHKHHLPMDVEHGTHVAYLTHAGDHEAKNPVARIALKPYNSDDGHTIIRPENSTYGVVTPAFEHSVHNFTEKHFPAKSDVYRKHEDIYDDTGNHIIVGNVSKALQDKSGEVRRVAIQHPNATPEHITQALKDESYRVRHAAIQHPDATSEHISKALQDEAYQVRHKAIQHPNATPEHITKALRDEDVDVRGDAIQHPNATSEHITQALKDMSYHVRYKAIENLKSSPEHISKALNDKHYQVRYTAIQHPNATPEHITQALKDEDYYVRQKAIRHPNVNHEHITKALKDEDSGVRDLAKSARERMLKQNSKKNKSEE